MFSIGSLFAGIGGIDLAFQLAGFEIAWQVEIDDYCRRVLTKHWPSVPKYRDVRWVCGQRKHWRDYDMLYRLASVDVLTGGFPCQDISAAGKGAGLAGRQSGLWYEFRRLIGELRPRVVFLENVAAIVFAGRGGTDVTAGLAALGYCSSWGIISAADAGAPHPRERWWCIAVDNTAHQQSQQPQRAYGETLVGPGPGTGGGVAGRVVAPRVRNDGGSSEVVLADTNSGGRNRDKSQTRRNRSERRSTPMENPDSQRLQEQRRAQPAHQEFFQAAECPSERPAQSELGRSIDGLSDWLDGFDWPMGRGIAQHEWEPTRTVPPKTIPNRTNRIRALGNAVVPQVVYPLAVEIWQLLNSLEVQ